MVWPIQQQPNNFMTPNQGAFPNGMPQPPQTEEGGLKQVFKPQGQGGQGLLSPERISGLSQKLGNLQQVLSMVQRTAPIIQEYGPMVKNLPPLIKMMRTLSNDNNADTGDPEAEDDDADDVIPDLPEQENTSIDPLETTADTENRAETFDSPAAPRIKTGESTPKLFI
ncbi:hypothetical protein GCM10028778_11270 [Barrientosiimonas marina]|uniref:VrrA/YqfQ family protein n=1 Tax=Lentibacillus kimchii TaxID=1542911 RepID=A0ABW2UZ46_9BACI